MRPMLAATLRGPFTELRFPVLASIKLDGIRAIVIDGVVMSRTMKPIPNHHVQTLFNRYEGYDGELIVGDPAAPDCYRKSVSAVMSQAGEPLVDFHVFDNVTKDGPLKERLASIQPMVFHRQVHIGTPELLTDFEAYAVEHGHEGIITRDPNGVYKQGRSTMNEQGMVKIKRFLDDEATVVAVEEQVHNANPAQLDERGYTKRTSHKANKIPTGVLGALVVAWQGKEFRIGTGFTAEERAEFWRCDLVGMVCKFKYLPIGMKDAPRHPVFLGWRAD